MKPEHIKVGQKYNFTLLATGKPENEYPATFETPTGNIVIISHDDFEAVSPINPYTSLELFKITELPEVAPKYDPCRLFKEGDRVKPRKLFGRCYSKATARIIGKICTVLHDEIEHYTVSIRWDEGECNIDPAYLELVTPVEELEPYEVTESSDYYGVDKDDLEVEAAIFWKKSHPNAKAAAEAERDRLNAEYRKELK